MEIRQLEYLVAVAGEASFTRAAQRLHVAQPGISAQIKQLEREVGQSLFDRGPRSVRPTAAGSELLRHAHAVLGALDEARESMDALAGLVRGRAEVGTVRGVPLGALAAVLGAYRRAHPGVDLGLREDETSTLLAGLRDGSVDLALIGLAAGAGPAGVTIHVVTDDRLCAVVAADDRWRARRTAPLAEVVRRDLVCLPVGTRLRAALDDACSARALTPHVAFEVGAVSTAIELARAGLGVALVPETAATGPLGRGTHAVTVTAPVLRSRLALAWAQHTPTDGRPAARALVATLQAHLVG